MKIVNALMACAAVAGLVLVQPALAAATRSAAAMPLIGAQAAASDSSGGDNRCGRVGDNGNVRIDANGNAILDAAGNMIDCGQSGGGAGGNGALYGLFGVGGAVGLALGLDGGGGDGDSDG